MSRNFGIPNATGRKIVRGDQFSGPHTALDTQRGSHIVRGAQHDSNSYSLARHLPPGLAEPNLAVVRGSPFIRPHHELDEVQPIEPHFDHREFAVYIMLSVFGISVGVLFAAATAFLDWSY